MTELQRILKRVQEYRKAVGHQPTEHSLNQLNACLEDLLQYLIKTAQGNKSKSLLS